MVEGREDTGEEGGSVVVKKWKAGPCHDCGVKEGGIHRECDMEICPICGGQLITCGCLDKVGGYDNLPFRIPRVVIPVNCALCGERTPLFKVPDDEWKKYVIPPLQSKHLCRECYEELKKMFPNGWKARKTDYEV